jgi:hypothetical protein
MESADSYLRKRKPAALILDLIVPTGPRRIQEIDAADTTFVILVFAGP